MGKISSTKRVYEILKDLNDGKILCLTNLAFRFDTSERTIRRDFELIKEIFGEILLIQNSGCYKAVNKFLLKDVLNSTELYMLKNIFEISKRSNLSLSRNIKKDFNIKEDRSSPYIFKQRIFEDIFLHKEKFSFLEHAITYKKCIHILYNNQGVLTKFDLNPYKIIFINENFYLASMRKKSLVMLRIALIESFSYTKKTFEIDYDFLDFLFFMQSPWAVYQKDFKSKLIEVRLEIQSPQAKYFKLKKFLPTQNIEKEKNDGSIIISYKISSLKELDSLIKHWREYIKILSPDKLAKIFNKKFKQ